MSSEPSPQSPAPADDLPPLSVQTAEQHRWLAWFGTPALVSAIFMAIAFGTGDAWILTFAVVVFILDIFILLMLVFTTDTNGNSGEGYSPAARPQPH